MSTQQPEAKVGTLIKITSHRKFGNGAIGSGRKGQTGKKATITDKDGNQTVITGTTGKALCQAVRKQLKIPPNIRINDKGKTFIEEKP